MALEELILTGVGIIHSEQDVPAPAVDVETLLSNPREFIDVKYVNLTPLCKRSEDVLCEFTECLTDKPNAVNLEVSHILLKSNKHIKLYHMLFSMCEITEKEIKTMLDFDVTEASSSLTSMFSSPVVSVKMKDGSNSFCIDFRALNNNPRCKLFQILKSYFLD